MISRRRLNLRKLFAIGYVAIIVCVVVLGVLYCTTGLPDYRAPHVEEITLSKLQGGVSRNDLIALLNRSRIPWAEGLNWQGCPPHDRRCLLGFPHFALMPQQCRRAGCDPDIVQAAFTRHVSACYDEGDVVTMEFYHDRLRDWRVEAAAGGDC
jgi:hypothetical protein